MELVVDFGQEEGDWRKSLNQVERLRSTETTAETDGSLIS